MDNGVYVIRNQQGHYWTRAAEWVDGREPGRVMKLKHRDEAVNLLVELSARDIELRGEILSCELNGRGEPELEASSIHTPTLAEKHAAEKAALAEAADDAPVADDDTRGDADSGAAAEPPAADAVRSATS